jgi:hypothetical protein
MLRIPPVSPEQIMATHRLRKSSMYRFHDSERNDRKFLIVALAAALILGTVLSGLGFTILNTFPK